jgi:hypothetical protein
MLGAILVGCILTAILFPRFLREVRNTEAQRELVRRCKGDVAQAGRLMAYEADRRSGMSRGEAAARALEALRRDNR